jgi:hypothetical protein
MMRSLLFTLLSIPLTGLAAPSPASINPPLTGITLRIEGDTSTIFEGVILTQSAGHSITTASGGTHHCDGTNGGQNPVPGPTASSALASAAAKSPGFPFDG